MEMEKAYAAKDYEDKIYQQWEKSGLFSPKKKLFKKPFTIAMPPPNATGTLHLGHAIMLALEDLMIRYHRMKGDPTLWVPGTDHASIATQNKVEQEIAKEGKTRHDLGREKFLERVHAFVKKSQNTIRNQIRKMGSSCDWTRERYTLDPGLSSAVQEVFVRMYKDGLIYRGDRIVNWCPRCSSTLADDEVEYKEERTKFYYFKYGPFVIGTARPETKFLDKIIVVHPEDKRYKKYIGKEVIVPWIEGNVKATILADPIADMEFGTGAMTITPAHSFDDFELAKKHGLEIVQIIDEKGILTAAAGSFAGRNARDAREKIVQKLREKGLLEKIEENYLHNLSVCYRCGTPIEPLVSKQWFVDVNKKFRRGKSLKNMAIEAVKNKKIKILPERFEKIYFHWILNLRDWCISRQIWFGHRIPVWYCINCPPIVGVNKPEKCPSCGSSELKQDPDTLDTWFSSGLWTFSTLGWPKKTKELKYFHPTSVLETGYDILFFWIARMILMSIYALDEIPFRAVYLHGLVRTRTGEKMSKSKPETCIDPLDMIEKYGADALRLSMIIGSGPGNDIRLYEEKIAGYRNFVNKIWNSARFALMNISEKDKHADLKKSDAKTLADQWILTRAQEIIRDTTDDIENFRFSEAGMRIYDFTWGEFCAWYLEISKSEHKNPAVLAYVLKTIIKLLHPFVPYVTEVLWEKLGQKNLLIAEPWPKVNKKLMFKKAAHDMQTIIDTVSAIRKMRHENNVDPAKKIHAMIFGTERHIRLLGAKLDAIKKLANLETLELTSDKNSPSMEKVSESLSEYLSCGVEIYLPIKNLVDVEKEHLRLGKELAELKSYLGRMENKLKNQEFRKKAPQELVKAEEEKLASETEKLKKLEAKINMLKP